MSRRSPLLGICTLILSVLWVVWVLQYLPTQSVSEARTCSELSSLAHADPQVFAPECERLLTRGPEGSTLLVLIVTCAALVTVSIALLARERNLLKRLG